MRLDCVMTRAPEELHELPLPQLPGGWTLPEDMPRRRATAAGHRLPEQRRATAAGHRLPEQRRPPALESSVITIGQRTGPAPQPPSAPKVDRGTWSVPPPRCPAQRSAVLAEPVLPVPATAPPHTEPALLFNPLPAATVPATASRPLPAPTERARPAEAAARLQMRRWQWPLLAGTLAVVTALAAGAPTVGDDTRSLTVYVDGQPFTITSAADTVGEALASVGISVGEHDVLAPAASAATRDGSVISIRRGRLVTATVDGQRRQLWTTATTVRQAMAELGLGGKNYQLSATRSRKIGPEGIGISGRALHAVVLKDGADRARSLHIAGATVADVLSANRIVLAGRDSVQPAAGTPVADGQQIVVTRIRVSNRQLVEKMAQPATRTVDDPDLGRGRTAVAEPGQDGQREITLQQTAVNGKVSEKVIGAAVVLSPQARVIKVGTKESGAREAWSVPWDKMAFCESTNRWSVNTGNGTYGGLQFMTPTWLEYGGGQFAPRADLATEEQQIIVAERLYAKEGLAPWHCARLLGWGFGKYQG